MAEFFAERVIAGKTAFDNVPAKLKASVAEVLIKGKNRADLVPDEYK